MTSRRQDTTEEQAAHAGSTKQPSKLLDRVSPKFLIFNFSRHDVFSSIAIYVKHFEQV